MLLDRYGNPLKTNTPKGYKPTTARARLTTDLDTVEPLSVFQSHKTAEDNIDWKMQFVREEDIARKSANDIIKLLLQSSPDMSRAHSDMQMFINTGFELSVLDDGIQPLESREKAQIILNKALETMEDLKEPLTVKINKIVSSMFLKGALYTEAIFDDATVDGKRTQVFIDLRVVNPFRISYQDRIDPIRGQYIQWGEDQNGVFIPIDSPFVQYIPVNPVDDSPLGTPMVGSAIFAIIFLLGMMKGVRQIIESTAYPMQLVTVDGEKMIASGSAKESLAQDIEELTTDIENDMRNASLNEVFIYGAEVGVQQISGLGKSGLDGIEMIQKILDQWIYRGLKQFPVVFGSTEGGALSSNAEQQLEAHSLFIDSLQSIIETGLTIHFTQILRNAGNMSIPVFRLRRTNALTDRIRTERWKLRVEALDILLKAGAISPQEMKDAAMDSEAIDNLSTLWKPEVQPDAQRQMTGGQNAEEQIQEEGNEGSKTKEAEDQ